MTKDLTIIENALDKAQEAIITQSTPPDEIRMRVGRGGRQLAYVDHAYVTRLLNNAFAFNWDYETDQAEVLYVGERPYEVKCRGKLTVRVGDASIVKMQYGCQPLEFLKSDQNTPVSLGDAFKGAASDALKKCASLLGIALDLYDSDSDINRGKKPQQSQQQAGAKVPQPTVVQGPKVGAEKKGNGHGKIADDPMSRYWVAVVDNGLSLDEGKRILAGAGGDATRALAEVQGISQVTPEDKAA